MNEAMYSWSTTTKLRQSCHKPSTFPHSWMALATTCPWSGGKAATRTCRSAPKLVAVCLRKEIT